MVHAQPGLKTSSQHATGQVLARVRQGIEQFRSRSEKEE
jgi:hypothetical protein